MQMMENLHHFRKYVDIWKFEVRWFQPRYLDRNGKRLAIRALVAGPDHDAVRDGPLGTSRINLVL
jgi:hypothetical protein